MAESRYYDTLLEKKIEVKQVSVKLSQRVSVSRREQIIQKINNYTRVTSFEAARTKYNYIK